MANDEHVAMLKNGVKAWNKWRLVNQVIRPDLSGALLVGAELAGTTLAGADLTKADLWRANLSGANLSAAILVGANLTGTNLTGARLSKADLSRAELGAADLTGATLAVAQLYGADLHGAQLLGTNLTRARLSKADFTWAQLAGVKMSAATLSGTIFADTDLSQVEGLDQCDHQGPSFIDFPTLKKSGPLPLQFLRGVGLPDNVIEYLPSLLNAAIQHYSCFISYSSKDQAFAERLHADLQNKGVRCWFAPHDMRIGAKIIDAIDEAIRLRDKVLLILSEGAIASDWVEGEVTRALEEERKRKQVVLFPVRLDDVVMQTSEGWARLLRGQRNIGDFTGWKEHDSYQKSFDRLMRDLRVDASA